MSNGQRSSLLQLLLKDRNHTSTRTKHIAKSSSNKLGGFLAMQHSLLSIQRLAIDLTDTLAAAHDISRVNRLVCRNHHKFPDMILYS